MRSSARPSPSPATAPPPALRGAAPRRRRPRDCADVVERRPPRPPPPALRPSAPSARRAARGSAASPRGVRRLRHFGFSRGAVPLAGRIGPPRRRRPMTFGSGRSTPCCRMQRASFSARCCAPPPLLLVGELTSAWISSRYLRARLGRTPHFFGEMPFVRRGLATRPAARTRVGEVDALLAHASANATCALRRARGGAPERRTRLGAAAGHARAAAANAAASSRGRSCPHPEPARHERLKSGARSSVRGAAACASARRRRGAPRPAPLPPCASAAWRTIASPSPQLGRPRASPARGRSGRRRLEVAGVMPGPWSRTATAPSRTRDLHRPAGPCSTWPRCRTGWRPRGPAAAACRRRPPARLGGERHARRVPRGPLDRLADQLGPAARLGLGRRGPLRGPEVDEVADERRQLLELRDHSRAPGRACRRRSPPRPSTSRSARTTSAGCAARARRRRRAGAARRATPPAPRASC